jgi:ribosomal protein S6
MRYELFYLIGASREADTDKIKEEVSKIVTEAGATFEEKETLEKRKMSYQIKHETHGIYIAQRFELDSEKIQEVSTKINLHPGVLRFIISRADEMPELRSKEERISDANAKPIQREEKPVEKKREKKKEEKPTVEEKPEETIAEKAKKDDDIDKKLEEILNI